MYKIIKNIDDDIDEASFLKQATQEISEVINTKYTRAL